MRDTEHRPLHCTWELTLACDLRCRHCGSGAGRARDDELTTEECLDVVDQLGELGTEIVSLSGGEPTRRDDWDRIARALSDRGVLVNMVTNGVYRDGPRAAEIARRAVDAGMCNVGISIDGPRAVHERMRGSGTFERSLEAVEAFRSAGLRPTVLTTISRLNLPLLGEVRQIVIDAGASTWRLQLGHPMGTMERNRDLVISPKQLLTLIPALARYKKMGGVRLMISDSVGYFSPWANQLRDRVVNGRPRRWMGCQAGLRVLGIQADGGIKGCLSLQARWGDSDPFIEGNLREDRLADIWFREGAFAYNREQGPDELTGACGACEHKRVCRGGAKCMAAAAGHVLTENPYCYHAVSQLEARRQRRAPFGAGAAAAAALLAIGVAPACSGPESQTQTQTDDPEPEPDDVDEYGVMPEPDDVAEYAVEPEPEPDIRAEYAVQEPDPDIQAEYAVVEPSP